MSNRLLYGDCLELMRREIKDETVDLIYLDPPFNSDTNYNMLFGNETGEDQAQSRAFADIWFWEDGKDLPVFERLTEHDHASAHTVHAMRNMLGRVGMLSYLLFMTERLIEMHRILRPTGSLYLHCDSKASHYLKIILDTVFGQNAYRNHITWRRATAHNDASRFGRISDHILFYTKTDRWVWNGDAVRAIRSAEELETAYPNQDERGRFRPDNLTGPSHGQTGGESAKPWNGYDVIAKGRVWSPPKTGRYADYIDANLIRGYRKIVDVHDRLNALDKAGLIHHPSKGFWPGLKRYADADLGNPLQDIILEPIGFTNFSTRSGEYLGYPTQKPLGLLNKLILASSNEGDVVLDPFCGCGTAVDSAQAQGREWIGMDISCLAINVIKARLTDVHGANVLDEVEIRGLPQDLVGARDLFSHNAFEFERWAVGLLNGKPNKTQVGDRGSDGILSFPNIDAAPLKGIISVKGGASIQPAFVRELVGTVESVSAQMGVLVTMQKPTTGMKEAARLGGTWTDPISQQVLPRIQIITVDALLRGERPIMPMTLNLYVRARYRHNTQGELALT